MSEGDALLEAILADPADDTPRLALADYLDENDQSVRAEFIRVQVEATILDRIVTSGIFTPGPPSHAPGTSKEFSRLCNLRKRERELWGSFGGPYEIARGFGFPGNWRASLLTENATYAPSDGMAIVRRGFVDEVRMACVALCGRPCSQCLRGYVPTDRDDDTCETCHGTSRIPGLAAAIFARHPVTRVVMTDSRYIGFGASSSWLTGQNGFDSNFHVTLRRALGSDSRLERLYDTKAEADQALSDVCVDFWRRAYLASRKEPARA